MAWVLENTSAFNIVYSTLRRLDNGNIVYATSAVLNIHVYIWNGLVETEIGDFSTHSTLASLVVFGDHVYVRVWDLNGVTNDVRVYRYDGTPGVWTLVDERLAVACGFLCDTAQLAATHDLSSYLFNNNQCESRSFPHPGWASDTLPAGASYIDDVLFALTNGNIYSFNCNLTDNFVKCDTATFIWSQIGPLPGVHENVVDMNGEGFTALYIWRIADGEIRFSQDDAGSWGDTGIITTAAPYLLSSKVGSVLHEFIIDNAAAPKVISYLDPSTMTWGAAATWAGAWITGVAIWNNRLHISVGNSIYYEDTFTPYVASKDISVGGNFALAFDVNADDSYLYIATIMATRPVLFRMISSLAAGPIKVYEPGAGDYANVLCGGENKEWVWIAGNFGVPKLRVSIDYGVTWITKDPGWANTASPFHVGPSSDNLVEAILDDNSVQETDDGGLTWVQRSADIGVVTYSMDRLDVHPDEEVTGADLTEAGVVRVQYTPNNFGSNNDVTGTIPPDAFVTSVIVG